MSKSNYIGIDLGTTFSAIARINERGTPEIIPNSEGTFITPSVVLFDGEEIIVGGDPQRNAVAYPGQVVEFIKRSMGERNYSFSCGGKRYTPPEISSFILKKLKTDAEEKLGATIKDVVVTVPAYFGILQKEATLEAGKKAGLNVLQLLNEPTAAAYSYGLHTLGKDQTVLVFDLGGGTLDITVLEVRGSHFEVKATEGDFHLGGKDWDDVIIQSMVKEFRGRYSLNPLEDPGARAELRDKAVGVKLGLSLKRKATLTYGYQGKSLTHEFTQEEFTRLSGSLVYRCRLLIDDTLNSAKLPKDKIGNILLAGGSTRMPMIREMLKDYFDKDPSTELNPDECVAKGAAIKAALLQKEKWSLPFGQKTWTLPSALTDSNVTSHSFGVVAEENGTLVNSVIIPKNTTYPCTRERSDYTTSSDNQETLDIYLIEGESKDPKYCVVLGKYEVYDLSKRPAGETTVKIIFRYNESGVVDVEATDVMTGTLLSVRGIPNVNDLNNIKLSKNITKLKIAVTRPGSDNVGAVLKKMNLQFDEIIESDLLCLADFDMLFVNCTYVPSEKKYIDSIEKFVKGGKSLYVSCYSAPIIDQAFKGVISFRHHEGQSGLHVKAEIKDKELKGMVGDSATVFYNTSWTPISKISREVHVHLAAKNNQEPLVVSFKYGKGSVIFSTFHSHVQSSQEEEFLLKLIALLVVSAACNIPLSKAAQEVGIRR